MLDGPNVDLVMAKPYTFPIRSRSIDVVVSGAVFEHIPFVWASMLEIGRVLRPGGYASVSAPSRGHEHNVYDCWRYYPDGYRALAAWSALQVRDVFTDFPPRRGKTYHHDYSQIDPSLSYWGDSVAVFQKPVRGYPRLRLGLLGRAVRSWANANPTLEGVPKPPIDAARAAIHTSR